MEKYVKQKKSNSVILIGYDTKLFVVHVYIDIMAHALKNTCIEIFRINLIFYIVIL